MRRPATSTVIATACFLLPASVGAVWLHANSQDETAPWIPCETGRAGIPAPPTSIMPPAPTAEVGSALELRHLLPRQGNTFLNDQTCGWFAGTASAPFTCASGLACATNAAAFVGCVAGASTQNIVTTCLDFFAAQQGRCANLAPGTGCCQSSAFPACGTYRWTPAGGATRTQFRCFASPTDITLLDVPQAVANGQPLPSSRSTFSISTGRPSQSSSDGSSSTESPTPGIGSSADGSSGSDASTGTTPSPSAAAQPMTGAIVGGAIGGVALVALVAYAAGYVIQRRRIKRRMLEDELRNGQGGGGGRGRGLGGNAGHGGAPNDGASGPLLASGGAGAVDDPAPLAFPSSTDPAASGSRNIPPPYEGPPQSSAALTPPLPQQREPEQLTPGYRPSRASGEASGAYDPYGSGRRTSYLGTSGEDGGSYAMQDYPPQQQQHQQGGQSRHTYAHSDLGDPDYSDPNYGGAGYGGAGYSGAGYGGMGQEAQPVDMLAPGQRYQYG